MHQILLFWVKQIQDTGCGSSHDSTVLHNKTQHPFLLFLFRVQGAGIRIQESGFRVQGSGCRVQGSGFMVPGEGSGFRIQGSTQHCTQLLIGGFHIEMMMSYKLSSKKITTKNDID